MNSSSHSINDLGFTLLEIVVVIGLLTTLGLIGIPTSTSLLQKPILNDTTTQTLSLLRTAQSHALLNDQQTNWGVCQTSHTLYLYHTSCTPENFTQSFPLPTTITINQFPNIQFNQLTGESNEDQTIHISLGPSNHHLSITKLGQITRQHLP